jgi:hypothetical protein
MCIVALDLATVFDPEVDRIESLTTFRVMKQVLALSDQALLFFSWPKFGCSIYSFTGILLALFLNSLLDIVEHDSGNFLLSKPYHGEWHGSKVPLTPVTSTSFCSGCC